jgi:hypothetical protein
VESGEEPIDSLRNWLDLFISSLQHPQERRIGYGNVRHEYSQWGNGPSSTTNIAIIYEVPGGSTCQINVAYSHADKSFLYLDPATGERVETPDVSAVRAIVENEISAIPRKRVQSLLMQVDRWIGEGMSRMDVFGQLNKLLQAEFLGGRINNKELQAAVQHVVRRVQEQTAAR